MKKEMIFPIVIFFLTLFFSCGKSTNQFDETFPYASFRDVPGVTDEEIRAIDAFREQRVSFVYGMTPSTEAFYSDDNTIKGFTALFCEWLTGFFGISFTPVVYEWDDLIAGLETAEIDFSGDLSPSEERRKTYFMTDAIAMRPLKYIRLRSSQSISAIAQTRPLRLVFFEGSVAYNHAVSSASAAFEPFFVIDNEAAYNLLESGRADAVLAENVLEAAFDIYGDVITEDFFPLIYSPVSMATHNPALESVISVVQKALKNRAPHFLTLLYNRGYHEYLKHKLFMKLSEKEKAYLQTYPVVQFAAEYDNYPLCFYNAQEKQWQGIAFDVMDEIHSLTGSMSFNVINDHRINWPVMVKMLEVGQVSMLTELLQSEERKGHFIWPGTTIITDNYALLSKSEFRNIDINEIKYVRVGLPRGTAYTELFKKCFPDHEKTVEYESSDSAFQALDRGEVDMVMSSHYRFLLLTNYRGLPDYKANVIFDYTFDSTFGFNKNEEILCSITDKALAIINVKEISEQWMRKTFDYRVKLMRDSIPLIIGATALVLGLIFMLVLFYKNRSEGRMLEKLIEERTAELHSSQLNLETALEAAKAADRSKSAFLANMSHEIRTPMNSILGFSELAMDGEASQKTRGYLEKICTNAQWLLQIINNILDLSKIESGKMELEKIPFDMHKLLTSCRTLFMPKAVEKGIFLHFYAEPSMGKRPLGDPTRLRQIFVNLLSNAVRFTNTGMVKLHCVVKEIKEEIIVMHFEVKDSGIGMTPEQIEKVFDPFTQAETGTTRKYGGTGLGLPITKDIIEMMGGQLSIESTSGIGSKFSFDLTFDMIEASDKELLERKMVLHEVGKPMFEGEILLCEDNAMNQQVICEHLARVGLKTMVADNGKIGLDMVQSRIQNGEKQFDLIFMDIHMPVMDGLEASSKIKELNTGVPVIAMTANIMTNDMEIYKTSGMDGCVGKPFTSQELWRCLLKYLDPVSLGETYADVQKSWLIDANDHIKTELEFQKNIQLSFVKNNQNTYEKIVKALEKGDINLAHRLVHTLKSNAGHIGKYSLQNTAAKAEEQLKEGKNLVATQQMDMLKAELDEALAELAPLLEEAEQEEAIQVEPLDVERARELLGNLEPLLKKGSPDCMNFIDSLHLIPGSGKLINQIDEFDFEAALLSLGELKDKI